VAGRVFLSASIAFQWGTGYSFLLFPVFPVSTFPCGGSERGGAGAAGVGTLLGPEETGECAPASDRDGSGQRGRAELGPLPPVS
jgi:hypothetical protein